MGSVGSSANQVSTVGNINAISFGASEPSATEYGKAISEGNSRFDIERKTVAGKDLPKTLVGLKKGDSVEIYYPGSTKPTRYTKTGSGFDYQSSGSFRTEKLTTAEAKRHIKNSSNSNRVHIRKLKR